MNNWIKNHILSKYTYHTYMASLSGTFIYVQWILFDKKNKEQNYSMLIWTYYNIIESWNYRNLLWQKININIKSQFPA